MTNSEINWIKTGFVSSFIANVLAHILDLTKPTCISCSIYIEQRTQRTTFFRLNEIFGFFHCHKCIEWHELPKRVSSSSPPLDHYGSKNTRCNFPLLLYTLASSRISFIISHESLSKVTQKSQNNAHTQTKCNRE